MSDHCVNCLALSLRIVELEEERRINHNRLAANDYRADMQASKIAELEDIVADCETCSRMEFVRRTVKP